MSKDVKITAAEAPYVVFLAQIAREKDPTRKNPLQHAALEWADLRDKTARLISSETGRAGIADVQGDGAGGWVIKNPEGQALSTK